jgi:malate dehydrogenase (quinone)
MSPALEPSSLGHLQEPDAIEMNSDSLRTDGTYDAMLVGGGIMSATLGALLKELQPDWSITVFEQLDDVAQESSHIYNNAGTGHSAFCELNYTPQQPDGSVAISNALKINELFEVSRQFWAYMVKRGHFAAPQKFISGVPHISFVRGGEDVAFLQKRFEALRTHPLFDGMEYSRDRGKLTEWMPLVMTGRDPAETVAATRARHGTDVNFGALPPHPSADMRNTRSAILMRTPAGGSQKALLFHVFCVAPCSSVLPICFIVLA